MTQPLLQYRALHRFALFTALVTLGLVSLGGLVTSHGVGMAVPDWPNTYGYNMFFFPFSQWVGGIFYEHTHRLVASGVGLLTGVLTLWLHGRKARPFMRWTGLGLLGLGLLIWGLWPMRWPDAMVLGVTGLGLSALSGVWPRCEPSARWLRRLGLAAFLAVVVQGILGGLRVVLYKDGIGVFHALLAQGFFVMICAIALFTSSWWRRESIRRSKAEGRPPDGFWLTRALVGATVLILVQLAIGATMRHQHAGLAIPDFPLAYGRVWPAIDPASITEYNRQRIEVTEPNPITATQIVLQMAHRLTALSILGAVAACAWLGGRQLGFRHGLSRWLYAWLGLITLQALLGAATIWSNKAADVATAHVAMGALSLALGGLLSLVAWARFGFVQKAIHNPVPAGAAPPPTLDTPQQSAFGLLEHTPGEGTGPTGCLETRRIPIGRVPSGGIPGEQQPSIKSL